tara:strand:- start:2593 stop:3153 length:561 start_codon:yes stop_codon:yes gene_type:complete
MTEEELLELFGEEFKEILDSLEQGLPEGMDDLVRAVMSSITFDTIIFGSRLTQYVENLTAQGLSNEFIIAQVKNDMQTGGRIFGELKNSIAAAIQELTNQAGRLGQLEQYGNRFENFMWITVAGHKVCPDCDQRGGMIDTFDNWVERGLPGAGWSVCRGFCYCVLDPTGTLTDNIQAPARIREPGA